MSNSNNVYEQGVAGDKEAARLNALQAPDEFSRNILGDIQGKSVLDVGAGTNTHLGDWVNAEGGHYSVMDPWGPAQTAQQAAGHTIVTSSTNPADISGQSITGLLSNTTIQDNQFDISHARFVLCHVPAALRIQGIQGLLRVSRERVIIIEHIGASMGGSPGAEAFKEALRGIEDDADIPFSTFYEDHLPGEVETAVAGAPYTVERRLFEWPEGPLHGDLIMGGERLMLPMLHGKPKLEAKMNEAIALLKTEQQQSRQLVEAGQPPLHIHIPDLFAIVVRKQI